MTPRMHGRVPRSTVLRAAAAGALLVVEGLSGCTRKSPPPPPPPTVLVAPVKRQDLPLFIEAVGTLDGFVNADIRARLKGYLRTQEYKDGAPVQEGQLLFTIEP